MPLQPSCPSPHVWLTAGCDTAHLGGSGLGAAVENTMRGNGPDTVRCPTSAGAERLRSS
jgi:hypothetical protein